jgi:hypothetical protein
MVFEQQSSCHGATAGESSLSSDGVETRNAQFSTWLGGQQTNKASASHCKAMWLALAATKAHHSHMLAYQRMHALTKKKA